jgi:catechol 2,3-dioxygenase-like lactoylglutathione lyase family enzyme
MPGFGLDHVQIAIPPGGEAEGRRFFVDVLGLEELPKPKALEGRGGCWFDLADAQIHLGVDPDFRAARKAHIALRTPGLAALRVRLEAAGFEVRDEVPIDGRKRFFTHDPFGNRIEFVEQGVP